MPIFCHELCSTGWLIVPAHGPSRIHLIFQFWPSTRISLRYVHKLVPALLRWRLMITHARVSTSFGADVCFPANSSSDTFSACASTSQHRAVIGWQELWWCVHGNAQPVDRFLLFDLSLSLFLLLSLSLFLSLFLSFWVCKLVRLFHFGTSHFRDAARFGIPCLRASARRQGRCSDGKAWLNDLAR